MRGKRPTPGIKWNEAGFVYLCFAPIKDGTMFVKVGISTVPLTRICMIADYCPMPLRRVRFICVGSLAQARRVEAAILAEMVAFRTRGEWLRVPVRRPVVRGLMQDVQRLALKHGGRALKWRTLLPSEISAAMAARPA